MMLLVALQNYHEDYFLLRYIGDDRYMNDHNFEIVCVLEQREAIEKVCDVRCDGWLHYHHPLNPSSLLIS